MIKGIFRDRTILKFGNYSKCFIDHTIFTLSNGIEDCMSEKQYNAIFYLLSTLCPQLYQSLKTVDADQLASDEAS